MRGFVSVEFWGGPRDGVMTQLRLDPAGRVPVVEALLADGYLAGRYVPAGPYLPADRDMHVMRCLWRAGSTVTGDSTALASVAGVSATADIAALAYPPNWMMVEHPVTCSDCREDFGAHQAVCPGCGSRSRDISVYDHVIGLPTAVLGLSLP